MDLPKAHLLNPSTGQHDPLILFNKFVFAACPPERGLAINFVYLSPDGKTTLSLIGKFIGRPDRYYRTLSLNGYQMLIHPLTHHFVWTQNIAWEWNDHYHGWVTYGNYPMAVGAQAVLHYDLANPEKPRVVLIPANNLPFWTDPSKNSPILAGVTPAGEGILVPLPGASNLIHYSEWTLQHKVPLALIDIDQGTRPPTNYLIPMPPETEVTDFVVSPDTSHIAWLLHFQKPHALPGQTKLYATDEIWVSELDGSHLHRLGYQAFRFQSQNEGLTDLAWKDNRTVSFILDSVLYTIPVQ